MLPWACTAAMEGVCALCAKTKPARELGLQALPAARHTLNHAACWEARVAKAHNTHNSTWKATNMRRKRRALPMRLAERMPAAAEQRRWRRGRATPQGDYLAISVEVPQPQAEFKVVLRHHGHTLVLRYAFVELCQLLAATANTWRSV